MIRIELTPDQVAALNFERCHYPHPRVQEKMEVLYLKSQGRAHGKLVNAKKSKAFQSRCRD